MNNFSAKKNTPAFAFYGIFVRLLKKKQKKLILPFTQEINSRNKEISAYFCEKIEMEKLLQPIEPDDIALNAHLDRETLKARLKIFIFELLQNDFGRLCTLMYRHDVNEQLFNRALDLATDDLRSGAIADLVIDREMQKIETRAMYAKSKNRNASNK